MDKGRIYIRSGERGNVEPLEEAPFRLEEHLQELIADCPALLDGRQITSHKPRRWLLVTREQGIADISDAGARWALDHLLVDQDAVPTLVEVKRGSNPEIRRKVVGQMLEYAAHAVRTWKADDLRRAFVQTWRDAEGGPDAKLEEFLQDESPPEDGLEAEPRRSADEFWDAVATNLAARKLRLLFVADAIPVELERVVEFLNEQMSGIEVLAVEIKRFQNQSNETFVPRVMGQHAKLRRPGYASRRKVTRPEFLESCDEHGKEVFSRILDFAHEESMLVSWGDKGFSLGVDVEETRVVFCAGYPPSVRGGQIFQTWLFDSRGGIAHKIPEFGDVVENLRRQAAQTKLFNARVGNGKDRKCQITRKFTADEVNALVAWCRLCAREIKQFNSTM